MSLIFSMYGSGLMQIARGFTVLGRSLSGAVGEASDKLDMERSKMVKLNRAVTDNAIFKLGSTLLNGG